MCLLRTGNALPAYIKPPKNFWADLLLDWASKGVYPGAETPDIPDEVDVPDVGDVVEGVGEVVRVGFVECDGLWVFSDFRERAVAAS